MANVNTTVIIEVSGHGTYTLGKHGAAANSIHTPLITATATATGLHEKKGSLAGATAALIYDATVDLPATFIKLFFWADQDYQIQLLTTDNEVTHSGAALDPFILSEGGALTSVGILASANTNLQLDGVDSVRRTDPACACRSRRSDSRADSK